jgi:dTDP-4-dehydrorhamnose 3,5-epimerase
LVIQDNDGKFHEVKADSEKPVLITVPNGIAAAIVNPTTKIAKVLVLADIAWRPNDNEMKDVSFDDYDWKKWKKN